eukprot:NODE_464_length_7114_cov_0.303350.p3 type:complete len:261 gc:universal NODE_464_length_7114_cov_0.303350:5947-6729(+)
MGVNVIENVSFVIYGVSIALFMTGVMNIFKLFTRIHKIPILIGWGFSSLLISGTISMIENIWAPWLSKTLVFVDGAVYPQAILISFWLYYKRLTQFFSNQLVLRIIKMLAILTTLFVIGDVAIYILETYGVSDGHHSFYYDLFPAIEFLYYLIQEAILLGLLLKNIDLLMTAESHMYMLVVYIIFMALFVTDILMAFLSFYQPKLSNLFYVIPFYLRLHSAICFYSGLKETHLSLKREFPDYSSTDTDISSVISKANKTL